MVYRNTHRLLIYRCEIVLKRNEKVIFSIIIFIIVFNNIYQYKNVVDACNLFIMDDDDLY